MGKDTTPEICIASIAQQNTSHSLQSDIAVRSQETERFKGRLLLLALLGAVAGIALAFFKHAYTHTG